MSEFYKIVFGIHTWIAQNKINIAAINPLTTKETKKAFTRGLRSMCLQPKQLQLNSTVIESLDECTSLLVSGVDRINDNAALFLAMKADIFYCIASYSNNYVK